jgi:hydrogenase maturation factor
MKLGKLPHDLLAALLARLPSEDPRVLVGPRVGEDAAAVELGDRILVAAMDPITFATDLIGWYAVHVNANDVAVMGALPRWFLATILLPEGADDERAAAISDQMAGCCEDLGVTIVGGHTEVTTEVRRPIVIGCMLGEVGRDHLLTSSGAQPGDVVVLAGSVAVEGTALLAREARDLLREKGVSAETLARARGLLMDPGISIVRAAQAAAQVPGVTAMHDPTEGGLATGLREIAIASGLGLEIAADEIPILPATKDFSAALGLHPLGLIASGCLLVTVRPEATEELVAALSSADTEASVIGRATGEGEGLWMVRGAEREPLPEFPRDEVARLFGE